MNAPSRPRLVLDCTAWAAALLCLLSSHIVTADAQTTVAKPAAPQVATAGDVQDFVLSDLRDLLNALPLTLHETALAFMESGNERDTADALGITRHEVRNRLDSIRQIWSGKLGEE